MVYFYDDKKTVEENRKNKAKMDQNNSAWSLVRNAATAATAVITLGLVINRVYNDITK